MDPSGLRWSTAVAVSFLHPLLTQPFWHGSMGKAQQMKTESTDDGMVNADG